ncbi:replicative helicase loader/inhibitor [Paenibacillus sp. OAE614]|uniref:replicative helicase loader/inhibitor n=1 Tax=Paenibacillus sp. OAE614 TaxID=2663804 RepID=UPI00178AA319
MNRAEVIDLFIEIKQEYPQFNDSDEEIDRHLKYLKDFPFEAALRNVELHIKTTKWPPGISDIRGRIGEQLEKQRMETETSTYFEKLDSWRNGAAPPPAGLKEALYAKLRKNDGD